ncbi:hypothetical protein BDZ45DRAFT_584815 [Acephala macrosclerotiorum]|nr:hypothetical protein BDZ45DRAFT_584815 [Acephala macrosclerotiorum]
MYSTLFSERARGAVGILSLTSQKQNFFNPIFPSLVITPPHLKHNHPEFSRSHSNDSRHGAITTQPWADAPYPLLHTPIFEQKFPLNKDTDQCTETASKMCITHNFLIRRLNTIVLQAKHVEPKDYKDFVGYTRVWCEVTNAHREDGGSFVFSQIKAAAGKEGLMVGNVREHEEFHPGLIAMKSYLDGLKGPEENFDGAKLYELINAFRKSLSHHLASEIPSLIGLKESGDRIPLRELFEKEGEKNMRNWGRRLRYRCDADDGARFEDGMWASWPPIPWAVRWIFCNISTFRHRGYWKFASCGDSWKKQKLYAVVP